MGKFEVPRGTRDFLPDQMIIRNYVESVLRKTFELYGFQQVKTPLFEKFDLFAARSGAEIRESMFTFVSDREEYALRPELTAPICRVVSSGKLNQYPLPYRLHYIGDCYRYCRPQANRYREFTQAGLELMGSIDPLADAELIAIAVKTLLNVGIKDIKLKIGNIGIVQFCLQDIFPDRFEKQAQIINQLNYLIKINEKCQSISTQNEASQDDINFIRLETGRLYGLQEQIGYSGQFEILPEQDSAAYKDPERINIIPKAAQATYFDIWLKNDGLPRKTVETLMHISQVRGSMDTVIREVEEILLNSQAVEALHKLSEVCSSLEFYNIDKFEVVPGLSRGLDFYTGTIFEIDYPMLGNLSQICGGGRYDKLIKEFGGDRLPATGFAFGFDRLVKAVEKTGKSIKTSPIDIFVACSDKSNRSVVVNVSEELRKHGFRATFNLLELNLKEQLRYASKLGTKYAVIISTEELKNKSCKLRLLSSSSEEVVRLPLLIDKIKKYTDTGELESE